MRDRAMPQAGENSRIAKAAWALSGAICLFTFENIWIDPWLRRKSHRIPSLAPDAYSGNWVLVLAMLGIALALLVVCQILVMKAGSTTRQKAITGAVVVVAVLLCGLWFRTTTADEASAGAGWWRGRHTVTLRWEASRSKVAGYNIYRSTTPGRNYVRINTRPVEGPTYTDSTVESGVTYYYVVRAVDGNGQESVNSNEAPAKVP
jgi:hypothetical protein